MIEGHFQTTPWRALLLGLSLALAGAATLPATSAHAAVYYVSPSGSTTSSGSSSSPWSLAKANSSLRGGDVCVLQPGTYSDDIEPTSSGTSGARITYVGSLSNPSQTTVGSISLNGRSYVSVKAVHAAGSIGLTATTGGVAASYDSVSGCIADGGLDVYGAWYCVISGNSIGTGDTQDKWGMGIANKGYSAATITAYCTFKGNTFDLATAAQPHVVQFSGIRSCTIERNRITATVKAGASDVHSRVMYGVQNCAFRDNLWQTRNETTYPTYMHNCRDSTSFNSFVRDSMIELGPGPAKVWASVSGSYPGSVRGNRYDHFYVRCSFGDTWYYQNGMRQDTLVYCTIINTSGPALEIDNVEMVGPALIEHNTFVGVNAPGVINLSPSGTSLGDSVIVTNNIFYNLSRSVEGRQSCSVLRSAAFVKRSLEPLRMNNNLFSYYGYINVPGDKSLGFSSSCDPGQYAVGSGSPWCSTYGLDCNSRYGSPMFVDTTLTGFNPRLRAGSIAIGRATDRSDLGAYPFGGSGPDVTPPTSVTDLAVRAVNDNNLELVWTAPYDSGDLQMASAYDLRMSSAPITASNFASATPVGVEPVTLPAGSPQGYVMLGLTPTTTYYFAIKSRDEQGNWSALSNVVSTTTRAADVVPPAAIGDLTTSP